MWSSYIYYTFVYIYMYDPSEQTHTVKNNSHPPGILEDESWRRNPGRGILEEKSRRREPGGGSWRSHPGGGILKEEP